MGQNACGAARMLAAPCQLSQRAREKQAAGLPPAPFDRSTMAAQSYSAQYDALFASKAPLDTRLRSPKPSMEEQSKEAGAHLIPLSAVWGEKKMSNWVGREPWSLIDLAVRAAAAAAARAPWVAARNVLRRLGTHVAASSSQGARPGPACTPRGSAEVTIHVGATWIRQPRLPWVPLDLVTAGLGSWVR